VREGTIRTLAEVEGTRLGGGHEEDSVRRSYQ
jgi:hypothetical protein